MGCADIIGIWSYGEIDDGFEKVGAYCDCCFSSGGCGCVFTGGRYHVLDTMHQRLSMLTTRCQTYCRFRLLFHVRERYKIFPAT